jgi:hypothetical protein
MQTTEKSKSSIQGFKMSQAKINLNEDEQFIL